MTETIDLDHTPFAVEDALSWARRLRRELGAVPMAGEVLPEFRYLLLYVGTATEGARIELLEPVGNGFLTRFLDRHGAGPHHLTFTVPDLRHAVAQARKLGATVVGEDYTSPSWQEAFLLPDERHGVVIQLAQTDLTYPTPAELVTNGRLDSFTFPSAYGATDPDWWQPVWETDAGGSAVLGPTHLASTDLGYTHHLFGQLLGATVTTTSTGLELSWPSGAIVVHARDRAGVLGMDLRGAPHGGLRIGRARLGPDVHPG